MSASAIAATISQGSARHKGFSGAGALSGLAAGSRGLSSAGSPVEMVASPVVISGEPEELSPRHWQPSLARNVSNLAGQPAVIVAVGWARDRLGGQRCRAFN